MFRSFLLFGIVTLLRAIGQREETTNPKLDAVKQIAVVTIVTPMDSLNFGSVKLKSPDSKRRRRNSIFRLYEKTAKNCGSRSLRGISLILCLRCLFIKVHHFWKSQHPRSGSMSNGTCKHRVATFWIWNPNYVPYTPSNKCGTNLFVAKGTPGPKMWKIAKISILENMELRRFESALFKYKVANVETWQPGARENLNLEIAKIEV